MSDRAYLLLLLGMGAATYLPRMLPLVALSRRPLPHWCAEWLELLPPAILSALIAPTLFFDTGTRTFLPGKPELIAALPTFLFAIKTRSLAGTVVVGMLCYRLLALLSGQ
jgi:branched-subunit amino acid transport protein